MGSLVDDICEYGDGGDSDDDCQVLKKIQFHRVLIAIVCREDNISSFTFSCIFDD